MKKHIAWIATPALAASLILTGCGQSEQTQPPAIEKPAAQAKKTMEAAKPAVQETVKAAETATEKAAAVAQDAYSKLVAAFSSADADTKSAVMKAVDLAKAAKYADALKELTAVAAKAQLTPEQKQALSDTTADLQKQAGSSAVQGAVDSATKSLPFGK